MFDSLGVEVIYVLLGEGVINWKILFCDYAQTFKNKHNLICLEILSPITSPRIITSNDLTEATCDDFNLIWRFFKAEYLHD